MRNGIYTYFRSYHLRLNTIRDDDEKVVIYFDGKDCPFLDFEVSKHHQDTYCLIIRLNELSNAYWVKTYTLYKGFKLLLFELNIGIEGMFSIATSDKQAFSELGLTEIDKPWFAQDIHISNLKNIWEERTPALGLPMPEGLKEKEFITPYAG